MESCQETQKRRYDITEFSILDLAKNDTNLVLESAPGLTEALIYGGWKTQAETASMDSNNKRNTLIDRLNQNSLHSIQELQQMTNIDSLRSLVGLAYITTFLKSKKIKTTAWRESNYYEEQRNALIIAINNRGFFEVSYLQSLSDVELYNKGVQAFGMFSLEIEN